MTNWAKRYQLVARLSKRNQHGRNELRAWKTSSEDNTPNARGAIEGA